MMTNSNILLNKEHIISNTAVVVSSCDKYSDIWPAFFFLFDKFWSECPYNIYLGSNFKTWPDDHIYTINLGEDRAWGHNLLDLLSKIKEKYIIFFLDDFLLNQPVNNEEVYNMLEYCIVEGLECLRLRPSPIPSRKVSSKNNIGVILPGEAYRISTQVSIWKKSFLQDILDPEMSAWEFEIEGSKSVNLKECKVYGVYDWIIHYQHCIERGEWLESGIQLLDKTGFSLTPAMKNRKIATQTTILRKLRRRIRKLFDKIIPGFIKRALRIFFFKHNSQSRKSRKKIN